MNSNNLAILNIKNISKNYKLLLTKKQNITKDKKILNNENEQSK